MASDTQEEGAPELDKNPQQSSASDSRNEHRQGQEVIPLPPGAEARLRQLGVDPSDPDVRSAVLIGSLFAGPIPSPQLLAQYNDIVPGLGERIISWTEAQSDHRRSLEKLRTQAAESRMNRGQFLAATSIIVGLGIAGVVAIFGNAWAASVIAIVAVGGPTAAVALTRPMGGFHTPVAPSSIGPASQQPPSSPPAQTKDG